MESCNPSFRAMVLFGLVVLCAWTPINAHHSFNFFFDTSQWTTIEGVVTEVHFQNPHVSLELEVTNEQGQTDVWAVETNHRAGLEREVAGGDAWLPNTVQVGDIVIAEGHPTRKEGSTAMHGLGIQRPSDGWKWAWRLSSLPAERRAEYEGGEAAEE